MRDHRISPESIRKRDERTLARFHTRYSIEDRGYESPCWIWTHSKSKSGYGIFQITRKEFIESVAHRAAYILLVGKIPDGVELDHRCRQRDCVNPEHLELVTHQVNVLRGDTFAATNAAKTHCPRGHAYSEENTYVHRGQRHCKTCKRIHRAKHNAKHKKV